MKTKSMVKSNSKLVTLTLTFAGLLFISQFSYGTIPNGSQLEAWWQFDGNAMDSSGNEHHGTEYGGPVYSDPVQSVCLDGVDDYIQTFNSPEELGTVFPLYAIEVTFKAEGSESGYLMIREPQTRSGANFALYLRDSGSIYGYHEDTVSHNISVNTSSMFDLSDGQWHTVSLVYDGDLKIYRDGILDNIVNNAHGPAYNGLEPIRFGHNPYAGSIDQYMAVCIADAKLYSVPEPATMSMLGLGGLALLRRRKV